MDYVSMFLFLKTINIKKKMEFENERAKYFKHLEFFLEGFLLLIYGFLYGYLNIGMNSNSTYSMLFNYLNLSFCGSNEFILED